MAPHVQLTIDCLHPSRLVAFWQPLLGWEVPDPPESHETWRDWYLSLGVPPEDIDGEGTDRLAPPDGQGVPIWFQPVPEVKAIKNRLHLDLQVSPGRDVDRPERRAAIEEVVATVVKRGGSLLHWAEDEAADHVYAVMADPEGNEFCLG